MNTTKNKKSIGKRVLKWAVSICLILIIALVSIPFLFKDKIVQMVTKTVNNNINATVSFKKTALSLFTHFPLASLTVSDIAVTNKAPFLGDTLYSAKELSFSMNITELLKKADEVIQLKSINTKNGQVNIIFNKENLGNYDIAIAKEKTNTTISNSSFSFDIQKYELKNMKFVYLDRSSNMKLILNEINHTGKGNFAQDILDLDTKSTANLSFEIDSVNYLNNVDVSLDAILGIDLKNSKYTFKDNTGFINQLPLEFDGFIQLVDENQLYKINFKTPTSEFKNLLALLPKQYSGNLDAIKTEGNFDLKGSVNGILSTERIPAFDISFSSENAMFKYDALPKAVKNINIDARIINKTGNTDDTYVNVNQLNFKIEEDAFAANGTIANLTTNPTINLTAKGQINLANINKAYPLKIEQELAGILKTDVTTNFEIEAIEKGNYQNIKNTGTIAVSNFKYGGKDVGNPFYITKTTITFNTNSIKLNEFDAKTGSSDIAINGNLNNFYGFLFNDEVLKGNFNLKSNLFKVSDFLAESKGEEQTTTSSTLKIPAFLDCTLHAEAKKVVYDTTSLYNVSGIIYIKDEAVNLKDLKSDVFGGKIGFDGNVSTKGNTSTFALDLKMYKINITESFSTLDMLKAIAPIANTIGGNINSTINLSGNLNDNLTPNLKTISGELFGQLLNPSLNISNSKILSVLGDKISFLDPNQLNLDGVNAFLSFDKGIVNIKPIPLKYKDIRIEISGNHSFDNLMNYDVIFDVPVKYLGTEVNNLIAKINPKDATAIKRIPINANLTGSFSSPTITTNLKDATANLIKNLVERQKQSLLNAGKDKLTDLLGLDKDKKDSTKTTTPPTSKEVANDKIKGILGELFRNKKTDTLKDKKQ